MANHFYFYFSIFYDQPVVYFTPVKLWLEKGLTFDDFNQTLNFNDLNTKILMPLIKSKSISLWLLGDGCFSYPDNQANEVYEFLSQKGFHWDKNLQMNVDPNMDGILNSDFEKFISLQKTGASYNPEYNSPDFKKLKKCL